MLFHHPKGPSLLHDVVFYKKATKSQIPIFVRASANTSAHQLTSALQHVIFCPNKVRRLDCELFEV